MKGGIIEVPKGFTLFFHGGRLNNGTVVFNETKLEGDVCINCVVKGTISNGEINVSWFGLNAGEKADRRIA